MRDQDETPVIFRKCQSEVTAVFPSMLGSYDPSTFTCYARIGQHGIGSTDWYLRTKAANPAEYEELRQELENVVGYRLKILRRMTRRHFEERRQDSRRLASRDL